MARQTQIQTTYDPSIYNEGVILQVDGSVLTKPVNEDGTSDPTNQQVLTEPGKGEITINQTVNGTLSTYKFNVNQKENQTITLPTINIPYYTQASEVFSLGPGVSHTVTLAYSSVGTPVFQLNTQNQPDTVAPSSISGSGKTWTITVYGPNTPYNLRVTYIHR